MQFVLDRYCKESIKRMRSEIDHLRDLLDNNYVHSRKLRRELRRVYVAHEKLSKEIERM